MILTVGDRHFLEDGKHPRKMAEISKGSTQCVLYGAQDRRQFTFGQHVECLAKREVTHHIEGIEREPLLHIHGGSGSPINGVYKLHGIFEDAWLILIESFVCPSQLAIIPLVGRELWIYRLR